MMYSIARKAGNKFHDGLVYEALILSPQKYKIGSKIIFATKDLRNTGAKQ